jgi:hypothetical protein
MGILYRQRAVDGTDTVAHMFVMSLDSATGRSLDSDFLGGTYVASMVSNDSSGGNAGDGVESNFPDTISSAPNHPNKVTGGLLSEMSTTGGNVEQYGMLLGFFKSRQKLCPLGRSGFRRVCGATSYQRFG